MLAAAGGVRERELLQGRSQAGRGEGVVRKEHVREGKRGQMKGEEEKKRGRGAF